MKTQATFSDFLMDSDYFGSIWALRWPDDALSEPNLH